MFDIVNIEGRQKVDTTDAQRMGGTIFRASMDRYMRGVIGGPPYSGGPWYRGFKITDKGGGQINVANGEAYFLNSDADGFEAYSNTVEGGEVLDLLARAPAVNFAWAAIVAQKNPQLDDVRPTVFLTDATSRATIGKLSSRLDSRLAKVDAIIGRASADPQMPTAADIPAGNVVVAYVKLQPSGVVPGGIIQNALTVLPSLAEARDRLNGLDDWRTQTSAVIDALGSNIAAIQGQLKLLPSANFVLALAMDVARIKNQLKVPQIYTLYGADHYLDETYSYTTHVDYLAHIEEGIRFPAANQRDSQLGLLNIYDPNVVNISDMLFPAHTFRTGLSSNDHDTTVICTQYAIKSIQVVHLTLTRQRIRVGPWYTACSNWFWWIAGGGSYNKLTGIFTLNDGENFEIYPDDRWAMSGVTSAATSTHVPIRIRQVWYDGTDDIPYTDVMIVNSSIQGAIHGNTYLCPQDGWLAGINLYFADKAPAGDLTVLMLQVPSSGQPDLTKVIGQSTLAVADIKISTPGAKAPTLVKFAPYLALQKGQRYAFVVVTQGGHTMWMSSGNKLANGSHFVFTDASWAQGDPVNDLAFELVFAQFNLPYVEVQLQPLNLDGGICQIDILAQLYSPSGTNISFQIQTAGVWVDIKDMSGDNNPLLGLPPLLPFKAVFKGTTDMMPALGVAANSRVTTARPRSDFRHLSDIKTLPVGATTKTITVDTRLEAWRGAPHHTHAVKLRYGANYATVATPTTVTDVVAPEDAQAINRRSIFTFANGINTFIIEQDGTTDNVVATFHVAEGDYVCS